MTDKGKSVFRSIGEFVKIIPIEKPKYQIHDTILFDEVEDAQNFTLPEIKEKVLYKTNIAKRLGNRRIYLVKQTDRNADDKVNIPFITHEDLYCDTRKTTGYYHIAAVQVLVKYLGNAGADIPVRIAIRDERQLKTEQSILGLWSSNLYTGVIYTSMELDYTLSAEDKNLDRALRLHVNVSNNIMQGSKNIAVSLKAYVQWCSAVQPLRQTLRNEQGKLEPGKSIVIKSQSTDVTTIPKSIPIDRLTYDLDFGFPRQEEKIKIGESSSVEFTIPTKDNLRIRLKEPEHVRLGKSKRYAESQFHHYLDDPKEEEDE